MAYTFTPLLGKVATVTSPILDQPLGIGASFAAQMTPSPFLMPCAAPSIMPLPFAAPFSGNPGPSTFVREQTPLSTLVNIVTQNIQMLLLLVHLPRIWTGQLIVRSPQAYHILVTIRE